MLDIDDVIDRFEMLTGLIPEEAERYRLLCGDAAACVRGMLLPDAPEEADRLFCFAAASLAAYRKALADSASGDDQFTAGDISVSRRVELKNARALWEDSVQALDGWLRDKSFHVESVRYP